MNLNIEIAMNILLVSNNDMCRSRMAQKILSSFGHGIRIFTSGVLPGRVIPSSVVGVMEQNGYDCSRKKALVRKLVMWIYIVISHGIM